MLTPQSPKDITDLQGCGKECTRQKKGLRLSFSRKVWSSQSLKASLGLGCGSLEEQGRHKGEGERKSPSYPWVSIVPQMLGDTAEPSILYHWLFPCWDQIPKSSQLRGDELILSEFRGMQYVLAAKAWWQKT